jgi:UrcA family protein
MNTLNHQKSAYRLFAMICAALSMGLAAPTTAGEQVGPDIAVRYADLAIDTEPGASTLLKRIEGAAGRVCSRLDHGTLVSRSNAEACSRKVTAATVSKMNHPVLLAVYNSARGATPPVASLRK